MLDTVRNKIWQRVRYQLQTTNCGNCKHGSDWVGRSGKCNCLAGLIFDILWDGICMNHSAFNGGNIKRS